MAKQLDPNELVSHKELLMTNSMIVDALTELLIEKCIITKEEFLIKLKEVQAEYYSKSSQRQ